MKLLEPGAAKLPYGPLPTHVGVIMDGNGRWASYRGLNRTEGHRAGWHAALNLAQAAIDRGVEWITFYAFTAENWKRPSAETSDLLAISKWPKTKRMTEQLLKQNVRVRVIGRMSEDSRAQETQGWLSKLTERTASNVGANVTIAFNYSGQNEIRDAVARAIVESSHLGLDEHISIEDQMYVPEMPALDLVIRTGGEQRISNFMLWHSAYAEFIFTDTLFPDFTAGHLDSALEEYAFRDRRFGGLPKRPEAY